MGESKQLEVVHEDLVSIMKEQSYRFPNGRMMSVIYSDTLLKATKNEGALFNPLPEDIDEQLDEAISHKVLEDMSPDNKSSLMRAINTLLYVHACFRSDSLVIVDENGVLSIPNTDPHSL